ncbi:glycine cleavage system protein T [candidate division TA06 bacterium DG_78]|uniref:Aminomethyltransferase n=1 Tax=candidate division TA06 bacterium DG_78 TaxID=1703772 RepID=A0A0S7YI64_UNCT6|nr:MAG: glycine cleavage system protein T [candidate division TA06 bacterium DG_78]
MLKKTAFYDMHVKNNGKIVEFAGFLMPIQFEGIISEHETVRTSVGVFDVSHMGEIEIRGKERVAFTNYITTNDASKLALNQIQYTTMLYPDAGIVDDLLVYNFKNRIFLVVNASNTKKDYTWITDNKKGDVQIVNRSDEIGELAIQGPKAEPVMQKLFDFDLSELKFYWATETRMNPASLNRGGMKDIPVILSRTGYTGEDGFELYIDGKYAEPVWEMVFKAGREFGIKPIGLGARDTLRFEMRYCLYGNDIDKTTNPLEAGLGWIVKFDKGDFIGKTSLSKIKEAGLKRKLVGFEVVDKGIPRPHQEIFNNDSKIGSVTSGTFSPSLKKGIGLGYVALPYNKEGTRITARGKEPMSAEVIKGPFYKHGSRK